MATIQYKTVTARSLPENKYYHGVVIKKISEFKKWEASASHEWVKETFGVDSTTNLSTIGFEALMENVRSHCLKHWGLSIPLPNETI